MQTSEGLLDDYQSREELAEELDKSPRTIDRWLRLGEGPPVTRVGRKVMFRRSSTRAWLQNLEVDPAAR